jgi:hypothetical protein
MSPNVFKQALSRNFGIWIRDDRWSRLSGTYRIMIEFILSLSKG